MVTQLAPKVYTPAEYLDLEADAEVRHEFTDGEIIEIAAETTKHNELVGNFCWLLKPILRKRGGRIYLENVKVWIPVANTFTYPDVIILSTKPEYYDERQTTVTNPTVIIEVLSESTRDYDQGRKFGFYRSIDSLQEYVLVDQDQPMVMVYQRGTAREWRFLVLDNLDDTVHLESVSAEIRLQDIYSSTT